MHMLAVNARSSVVTCGLDRGSPTMSQSNGRAGCGHWEREAGIDDDGLGPVGVPRIAPYVPEPPLPTSAAQSQRRGGGGEGDSERSGVGSEGHPIVPSAL